MFGEPELSGKYTVEQDGTFTFPQIGRVKAGGLTLRAIEQSSGKPAIRYVEQQFTLREDPANTRGSFEPAGSMGLALPDFLRTEGTYTFHARASYGECDGTRELVWTVHVDVGVDPGHGSLFFAEGVAQSSRR